MQYNPNRYHPTAAQRQRTAKAQRHYADEPDDNTEQPYGTQYHKAPPIKKVFERMEKDIIAQEQLPILLDRWRTEAQLAYQRPAVDSPGAVEMGSTEDGNTDEVGKNERAGYHCRGVEVAVKSGADANCVCRCPCHDNSNRGHAEPVEEGDEDDTTGRETHGKCHTGDGTDVQRSCAVQTFPPFHCYGVHSRNANVLAPDSQPYSGDVLDKHVWAGEHLRHLLHQCEKPHRDRSGAAVSPRESSAPHLSSKHPKQQRAVDGNAKPFPNPHRSSSAPKQRPQSAPPRQRVSQDAQTGESGSGSRQPRSQGHRKDRIKGVPQQYSLRNGSNKQRASSPPVWQCGPSHKPTLCMTRHMTADTATQTPPQPPQHTEHLVNILLDQPGSQTTDRTTGAAVCNLFSTNLYLCVTCQGVFRSNHKATNAVRCCATCGEQSSRLIPLLTTQEWSSDGTACRPVTTVEDAAPANCSKGGTRSPPQPRVEKEAAPTSESAYVPPKQVTATNELSSQHAKLLPQRERQDIGNERAPPQRKHFRSVSVPSRGRPSVAQCLHIIL